jgi:serine/threonine protein phosphatase PrpC
MPKILAHLLAHVKTSLMMTDEKVFDWKNTNKVHKLLLETCKITNNEIGNKLFSKISRSGSTGVMTLIIGNMIYCANVGDSEAGMIYRKGKKFDIKMMSVPHLPTNPTEKKRIELSGGVCQPYKRNFYKEPRSKIK